jgi:formylglycine-generating enzyme required for sulfatase activity
VIIVGQGSGLVKEDWRCIAPGAGQVIKDCDNCPEMVVVPAGRFSMGSPSSEDGRFNNEGPEHQVAISRAFAAGRFAVTRAEYGTFIQETGHNVQDGCQVWTGSQFALQQGRSWRSPGFGQDNNHPVVCVNWDDAKAFATWLSNKTSKPYRLLTEAEREYVARAGTTTPFWWGNSISGKQAVYFRSSAQWRQGTLPVDSFKANPWGLYNVHGNAWDWVEDCWYESYQGAPTDGAAWITGGCSARAQRGGSWNTNSPTDLRSAARSYGDPQTRFFSAGFRVARTLEP